MMGRRAPSASLEMTSNWGSDQCSGGCPSAGRGQAGGMASRGRRLLRSSWVPHYTKDVDIPKQVQWRPQADRGAGAHGVPEEAGRGEFVQPGEEKAHRGA